MAFWKRAACPFVLLCLMVGCGARQKVTRSVKAARGHMEAGDALLIVHQHAGSPGVAKEEVWLVNGNPEVHVVDNGGIDLLLFQPPSSGGF